MTQLPEVAPGDPHVAAHNAERELLNQLLTEGVGGSTGLDAESVRDLLATVLVPGSNVTITPDDNANTVTISATASSGGSSASLLPLDIPWPSPSALDDDFSVSDVDPKWVPGRYPPHRFIRDGKLVFLSSEDNKHAFMIRQVSPSSSFEVKAKISSNYNAPANDQRPGIFIAKPSGRAVVAGLGLSGSTPRVAMAIEVEGYSESVDWPAYSGNWSNDKGPYYSGDWVWHRIRWDANLGMLYFDYSIDGVRWKNFYLRNAAQGWTQPSIVGLASYYNQGNSYALDDLSVAWFRARAMSEIGYPVSAPIVKPFSVVGTNGIFEALRNGDPEAVYENFFVTAKSVDVGWRRPGSAVDGSYAAMHYSTEDPGQWWMVDFSSFNKVSLTQFAIRGRSGDGTQHPRNFKLQGSNDDSAWTDLYTAVGDGPSADTWWTQPVSDHTPYRYIRILNTGNNSSFNPILCIPELELYGTLAAV